MAFSRAQASQPVIYGIGTEGSFIQAGSNIQWDPTQPWNGDNIIELRNNTTQYAMIPVIPNGKDKGWGIVNNKLTFTITEPINGITITKWVNQNNTWIQVDITETILNKLKIN